MSDREVVNAFRDLFWCYVRASMEPGPCQTGKVLPRRTRPVRPQGASMEPGPCQTGKLSSRGIGGSSCCGFNGARSMSDREGRRISFGVASSAVLQWSPVHVRPGRSRTRCRAIGHQANRFNGARSMSDREVGAPPRLNAPARPASMEPGPCQTGKPSRRSPRWRSCRSSLQWSPVHVRPGRHASVRESSPRTVASMEPGPCQTGRLFQTGIATLFPHWLQWSPVHVRPGRPGARRRTESPPGEASMEPGPCQTGKSPRTTGGPAAPRCSFNGARSMSDREAVFRLSANPELAALLQWSPVHVRPGRRRRIPPCPNPPTPLQWSPVHVRPGRRTDEPAHHTDDR